MPPLIALEQVHKRYLMDGVAVHALRGIDLAVERGELLAIMGPSGSGKSTLMHILGCLDLPDSGRYRLDGVDVTHMDPDALAHTRNRTIGFVFQSFNLLARTSALENVETPLIYAGVGRDERRERARAMLERMGLGDRMGHLPSQLSGGQQQRVALARALVTRPPLLLADEPTGNLDSRTSAEILALLDELNHAEGVTVVLITHEEEVAQRARRRLTLRDGRLDRPEGPP
ncbi:MAG: ABC transporter ATP-binding protein [Chromatiaceae bacterium]|jgi:putative ABC transport system ATP-binding protein|nr:ABC transporter ATP-binding protein [Chromatiaceae bacterium]